MWRATGGLRGFRSCVGSRPGAYSFDAGERREGEFGQAVEQWQTWSRDHTPEISRGPHGRNRPGRTFRLPWLRAERAHPGIRRAPGTWTGEIFPLASGSPPARHQGEHESAWRGPGHIFVSPKKGPGEEAPTQDAPLIVDSSGEPVWFHPLQEAEADAFTFEVQKYKGETVLTWWEGLHTGYGQGEYVIFDHSYREIARFGAGNGYEGDHHEFLITPQDTALITIYSKVQGICPASVDL